LVPSLPLPLRLVRNLLQRLNYHFSPPPGPGSTEQFDAGKVKVFEDALRQLPGEDDNGRAYLEKHLSRLARTLAMVPQPGPTSRALELGCYMHITPLLQSICGYAHVRGAYYGQAGEVERKTIRVPDGEYTCEIDLFNVEKDRFPYPDEHFDLVIAGEIIEHLIYDPMHMLLEARRVLAEGGFLLITTPNVGSITTVARALYGGGNPQIFSLYSRGSGEVGHVREYTLHELGKTVHAAGFEVATLFTTFIEEFEVYRPLLKFLKENGYDTEHRGEQTWCLARKRADLPVDRYPRIIYSA
jgi:SAM-dependent methyltransferase